MSRFFIERPIFAWVIAIGIMLAGLFSLNTLPIAQYPDVAPPQVSVSATYPGATAEVVETSVTQVIEQQLTGLDGLLYFSSSSSNDGSASITLTFEKGVDPDTAQVQTQNQVQTALSRLPQPVQQQGVRVRKSQNDTLLVVGVFDSTDRATRTEISDWLASNMEDRIARVEGVGSTRVFGSEYAMRIWLDPYRLAAYRLIPADVVAAIEAQNVELSAGQVGAQPAPEGQQLNATVSARSRLETPDQFANIIVKSAEDGSIVRLRDVARVELGEESYGTASRYNEHPATGMIVQLAPGADALTTAELVKTEADRMTASLPDGWKIAYPRDSTTFIRLSIEEVVKTLIEAVILVVIVMFLFLQSWRATLVPALAVPVVLLGTFGVLALFGFSINTLTLFGMVLAIGLLVDDAIVVVENVERLMEEEDLDPKAATIKSMDEIGGALVGIGLVLSAVLLPMAFFGGSVGVIYRQFSITIVSAMALSVVVALIFSPALTSTLLRKPEKRETAREAADRETPATPPRRSLLRRIVAFFRDIGDRFNRWFRRMTERYVGAVESVIRHPWLHMGVFAVICALLVVLFLRLPSGFLPNEDQGSVLVQFQLPSGATTTRTDAVAKEIETYIRRHEGQSVESYFIITGFSFSGSGQNAGFSFVNLKPWDERTDVATKADTLVQRLNMALSGLRDARVFALLPPPIQGLGQAGGFEMQLLNSSGMDRQKFAAAREAIIAKAAQDPSLVGVRASDLGDIPQLKVELDDERLSALGLSQGDVSSTLNTAWGGNYVNDFVDRGRIKRVYVQGDAEFRALPQDLYDWQVRSSDGMTMAPFSSFATLDWQKGPSSVARFQGQPAYQIQGSAAPGTSTGTAMDRIEAIAQEVAPGTSVAWSGISYQERQSSGQAPLLYAISLLVVFLCLAALYESWSVPIAVLLVIPIGLLGAVMAVWLRGLENNIFFQVGLLTTMGLAAKNAILIVEFAEMAYRGGKSAVEAAVDAARLRFRPIIMTSLAFGAGVIPLVIASGAGAQGRIAIGTAVFGGIIASTVIAIFYVPLFFVLVLKLFGDKGHGKDHEPDQPDRAPPPPRDGPAGAAA